MYLKHLVAAGLLSASRHARADTVVAVSGTFASGAVLGGTVTALPSGDPLLIDATVMQGHVVETFFSGSSGEEDCLAELIYLVSCLNRMESFCIDAIRIGSNCWLDRDRLCCKERHDEHENK